MERTTCCVVGGGPAGMMLGPLLALIPGYLIAIGFRPEHAPAFAKR